ncbi:MAG: methyltransferase domain-containing protein [Myxococcales bacterium]|nr:methyltransferase domain-containing protein [Myxococcales bacterium]MCB9606765.1 methyltransferase domain-containing protein [Polyangiaceae bacterium]
MSQVSGAVDTARDYYNSEDADSFYSLVWGGEDIHIGLYETGEDAIFDASRRTVAHMASQIDGLGAATQVLDIGSGYGGAARYLAKTYGCHVTALNLAEVENQRARKLNQEQGLADQIEVIDGSFEKLPFGDASFDVVWSQDAILHSGNREAVVREVSRVLRRGGQFIFTDPMQSDNCPAGVLQPILDRIHLQSLGSPRFYRAAASANGLLELGFEELTRQLSMHYGRVLQETVKRADQLKGKIAGDYIERMQAGLKRWVDGGEKGYLSWGIFRFRKE